MHAKAVPTPAKLEQVALAAARAAGRIHLRRLRRIKVTRKANAIDFSTQADRESEKAVIRMLNRAFPDHAILAEESGANARTSEHRWIIDPLDGTTNFAHGFPQARFSRPCTDSRVSKYHARDSAGRGAVLARIL